MDTDSDSVESTSSSELHLVDRKRQRRDSDVRLEPVVFTLQMFTVWSALSRPGSQLPRARPRHGGSRPGWVLNRDIGRSSAAEALYSDYFAPSPIFSHAEFRRRFRLPMPVYIQIRDRLQSTSFFRTAMTLLEQGEHPRIKKYARRCACSRQGRPQIVLLTLLGFPRA